MKVKDKIISRDGSKKYHFYLDNDMVVEASFFYDARRERPYIACVSTQLGCAVGCLFCAASHRGYIRNLTTEEILLEVSTIVDEVLTEGIPGNYFEISFMGTGEPLANLQNLLDAINEIHQRYPLISRVSISTSGPAKYIDALTASMPIQPPVHLQISLHATKDKVRQTLVPGTPESIEGLLEAGRQYHLKTNDQVCLNYILFQGINDAPEDAIWLSKLDPEVFFIKISQLNPTEGLPFTLKGAAGNEIREFNRILQSYGMPHRIFIGDGLDIQASCGQLAAVPVELPLCSEFHASFRQEEFS